VRILCLYVRHGTGQYPEAPGVLDRWYDAHGLLEQRTLWIIDNALPADTPPQELAPGVTLRPGDNRAWEFSAWARALREAATEAADHTVVHFVTSAFHTLYTGYLGHFHAGMLDYVAARGACLGHIDHYDRPITLSGQASAAWVRTCFFFLPMTLARQVQPWAAHTDPTQFFTDPGDTRFRNDAPITPDHQTRIRTWLEGREVGGHTWHSPVGPGEAARFQQKTLAIVNEHSLAVTLRRLGIPLVDYCWLHEQRAVSASQIPAPPSETEQLRLRRRILGIPEPAN